MDEISDSGETVSIANHTEDEEDINNSTSSILKFPDPANMIDNSSKNDRVDAIEDSDNNIDDSHVTIKEMKTFVPVENEVKPSYLPISIFGKEFIADDTQKIEEFSLLDKFSFFLTGHSMKSCFDKLQVMLPSSKGMLQAILHTLVIATILEILRCAYIDMSHARTYQQDLLTLRLDKNKDTKGLTAFSVDMIDETLIRLGDLRSDIQHMPTHITIQWMEAGQLFLMIPKKQCRLTNKAAQKITMRSSNNVTIEISKVDYLRNGELMMSFDATKQYDRYLVEVPCKSGPIQLEIPNSQLEANDEAVRTRSRKVLVRKARQLVVKSRQVQRALLSKFWTRFKGLRSVLLVKTWIDKAARNSSASFNTQDIQHSGNQNGSSPAFKKTHGFSIFKFWSTKHPATSGNVLKMTNGDGSMVQDGANDAPTKVWTPYVYIVSAHRNARGIVNRISKSFPWSTDLFKGQAVGVNASSINV